MNTRHNLFQTIHQVQIKNKLVTKYPMKENVNVKKRRKDPKPNYHGPQSKNATKSDAWQLNFAALSHVWIHALSGIFCE